ncbi:MAG: hypothetical protein ACK46D_15980, partial [Roseiflexaceae bacterium]
VHTTHPLCNKTLATGKTIFDTTESISCSTPFDVKSIAVVPSSIDQGFVLLGDGSVRDAYLKRGNVLTAARKIVNANPCVIGLRTNGQASLLNKPNVTYGTPTDIPSLGFDAKCYGISSFLANRVFRDISALSQVDYYSDPRTITGILTDGSVHMFHLEFDLWGDESTWNDTKIYTPTVPSEYPIHAGLFPSQNNAVLVMNDGSMRYLHPITNTDNETCTFPDTMSDAVKIEVVDVNQQVAMVDNTYDVSTLQRYIYAQKSDGSLWRWRVPFNGDDSCNPMLTQLSTGIDDFVVNAYGIYAIEKTANSHPLRILVQPQSSARIIKQSRVGGIYVYAHGGSHTTATEAINGLRYQWYRGSSGDASMPVTGATANILDTTLVTQAGDYWAQVTDGTNNKVNSSAVSIELVSYD